MDIRFDEDTGKILLCIIEGKIPKADNVITVPKRDLPEDFHTMFPLGKYNVKNGKIVPNKRFTPRQPQPSGASLKSARSGKPTKGKRK